MKKSECECGNEKTRDAKACDRCIFLDGDLGTEKNPKYAEAWLISELRMLGGSATLTQLRTLTVPGHAAERALYRALDALEAKGRIKRSEIENDEAFGNRGGANPQTKVELIS